jgi:protein-disulfide isomerase
MHRYRIMNIYIMVSLTIGFSYACVAQDSTSNIYNEMEALKRGQQAIHKELQEIKALLIQSAAFQRTPEINVKGAEIELGNSPIKGSDLAKLIIVEFSDYQCAFCSRYVRETFPQIVKQYVDSGKARYAIIDMPIASHKYARKAAEASHCAGDQGMFWEMHNQMMSQQEMVGNSSSLATALALNMNQFEDCLKTDKYAQEVQKGFSIATKLGIPGVPGFIIAINGGHKAIGISFMRGAQPFANFQKEIDQALANIKE